MKIGVQITHNYYLQNSNNFVFSQISQVKIKCVLFIRLIAYYFFSLLALAHLYRSFLFFTDIFFKTRILDKNKIKIYLLVFKIPAVVIWQRKALVITCQTKIEYIHILLILYVYFH